MIDEHELVKYIDEYKKNHYGKECVVDGYLFKPLENIPSKKGKEEENRNGFLVYSQETIKNTKNTDLKNLFKNVNIGNEDNIFRYYYYEKLNSSSNLHATIIMINHAFADSEEPDPTINNIKEFLNNLDKESKFSSFDIVNLYPVRMPKSAKLKLYLDETKKETEDYQAFVKSYLNPVCEKDTTKNSEEGDKDENIIIAAWGSNARDNKTARELFNGNICKLYCYGMTAGKCPKHFSSLSYNDENQYCHLVPYLEIEDWLIILGTTNLSSFDKDNLKKTWNLIKWLDATDMNHKFIQHHKTVLAKIKEFCKEKNIQ